jgi:hypothetical protein
MGGILTRFRSRSLDALRQLLDLALGCIELAAAEAIKLLAALPEHDRLVQAGVPALEPLDDLLELSLRRFEGRLLVQCVSSTVPPKPPSASSTSTRTPGESAAEERTIPLSARTIA